MLEIINGTKKYGGKTVLNNINYKFEDGKMYGIKIMLSEMWGA